MVTIDRRKKEAIEKQAQHEQGQDNVEEVTLVGEAGQSPLESGSRTTASAMVGPCELARSGFAYSTLEEVLDQAGKSAAVTHNHPEGIKVPRPRRPQFSWLVATKARKRSRTTWSRPLATIWMNRWKNCGGTTAFSVTCQGTVPAAMIVFFASGGLRGRRPQGRFFRGRQ